MDSPLLAAADRIGIRTDVTPTPVVMPHNHPATFTLEKTPIAFLTDIG